MVRPITRPMRWTIMLVALLQGIIVNETRIRAAGLLPLHAMPELTLLRQLSLTFTVTLAFVGLSLRQRALWVLLAGILALVAAPGVWQYGNQPERQVWHAVPLLNGPFVALALLLYLLLPWLQSRLASGRWGDYPTLFSAYWHNSMTGLVMLLAILLGWVLMWLCTALFALVGITWFTTLFLTVAEPSAG